MQKKKRIVDKKLLESYRGRPCVICGDTQTTVAHHLKSRGAGGDDVESNLLAVCFHHHRMIHDKGLSYMRERFPMVFEKVSEL